MTARGGRVNAGEVVLLTKLRILFAADCNQRGSDSRNARTRFEKAPADLQRVCWKQIVSTWIMFRVDRAGSTQKKASLIERKSYFDCRHGCRFARLMFPNSTPDGEVVSALRRRVCPVADPRPAMRALRAERSLPNETIGSSRSALVKHSVASLELRVRSRRLSGTRGLHCFHRREMSATARCEDRHAKTIFFHDFIVRSAIRFEARSGQMYWKDKFR